MIIIIGIVLLVIGAILLWQQKNHHQKAAALEATDTLLVSEILETHQEMRLTAGAGNFRLRTEVKGTIRCGQPLSSPVTNTPCVYFKETLVQEYDEWEPDREKPSEGRWQSKQHTLSSTERFVPFEVVDSSGAIEVRPEGADWVSLPTASRTEPLQPGMGAIAEQPGRIRHRAIRREERCIPMVANLYVLAEASDSTGTLAMAKPAADLFIISAVSEEELIRKFRQTGNYMYYGGIGLLLAGIGVLVYGFLAEV